MTNEEIVSSIHKMVDSFAEHLANPILQGTMPLLRISFKVDDNGDRLRLIVGADFVEDDE
jgi:hypothetical protein